MQSVRHDPSRQRHLCVDICTDSDTGSCAATMALHIAIINNLCSSLLSRITDTCQDVVSCFWVTCVSRFDNQSTSIFRIKQSKCSLLGLFDRRKMKLLWYAETSVTTHLLSRRHMPEVPVLRHNAITTSNLKMQFCFIAIKQVLLQHSDITLT
jgi:hypothetical protein